MTKPAPSNLAEQFKNLEQVQEYDFKIDSLKKKKSALPAALKSLDEALVKCRLVVETKKKAGEDIQKILRQTQAAVDLQNDRLVRSSSKLEGVQNHNEFTAANKEIDQLKKSLLTLDEQITKAKADVDVANQAIATAEAEVLRLTTEHGQLLATITGEGDQLESGINALLTERGQYTGSIDPRILSQYDRVRGARGGIGIAPAVAGRCRACNMILPPQFYNELHRMSAVQQCPSCHRLLFLPGQGQPVLSATGSGASETSGSSSNAR